MHYIQRTQRVDVATRRDVHFKCSHGGQGLDGRVLDVSEGGLRLELAMPPASAPSRGGGLENSVLTIGSSEVALELLFVEEVIPSDAHSTQIRIVTDEIALRARLWVACQILTGAEGDAVPAREAYVIVMELLRDVVHFNAVMTATSWGRRELEAALDGAAALHAIWLGKEDELARAAWLGHVHSPASMIELTPLWLGLADHAHREFPEWFTAEDLGVRRNLVGRLSEWWPALEHQPRTLIHNDFNPRNLCFRRDGERLRLCVYDWELATLQVPQHDLAELLAFTIAPTEVTRDTIDHYVEHHRVALERESGRPLDRAAWRAGYRSSLWDFALNRMGQYLMAHTVREYDFIEGTHANLRALLALEER